MLFLTVVWLIYKTVVSGTECDLHICVYIYPFKKLFSIIGYYKIVNIVLCVIP